MHDRCAGRLGALLEGQANLGPRVHAIWLPHDHVRVPCRAGARRRPRDHFPVLARIGRGIEGELPALQQVVRPARVQPSSIRDEGTLAPGVHHRAVGRAVARTRLRPEVPAVAAIRGDGKVPAVAIALVAHAEARHELASGELRHRHLVRREVRNVLPNTPGLAMVIRDHRGRVVGTRLECIQSSARRRAAARCCGDPQVDDLPLDMLSHSRLVREADVAVMCAGVFHRVSRHRQRLGARVIRVRQPIGCSLHDGGLAQHVVEGHDEAAGVDAGAQFEPVPGTRDKSTPAGYPHALDLRRRRPSDPI
mmetsp:Transcript_23884/g.61534  ORF Transcript_23884/g.61534 Transcript_23884/m.61534 type:complete len:307 (-) Transcript_23884:585-1505(-)